MSAPPENDAADQPGTSGNNGMDELEFLNFPPDVDWSTTLLLRCDPAGGPYKLIDIANALHFAVRRNNVHNLGPTVLNYTFTISFKTERFAEDFLRFHREKRNKQLTVRNRPCEVFRIPMQTVSVSVRWIPVDIDTVHITDILKQYGTIVKTELVRNDKQGWFHVYTGERRFKLLLKSKIDVDELPYSFEVKGLIAAVLVAERNPKCLDCFYVGHEGDICKHKGCILYKE